MALQRPSRRRTKSLGFGGPAPLCGAAVNDHYLKELQQRYDFLTQLTRSGPACPPEASLQDGSVLAIGKAEIRPEPHGVQGSREPNVVHGAPIHMTQVMGVTHYDALRSSDFPPTVSCRSYPTFVSASDHPRGSSQRTYYLFPLF